MKKTYLLLLFVVLALSCKNADTAAPVEETVAAEENIELIQDEQLIGQINKQELQEDSYAEWYETNYNDLIASEEVINEIDENIHDYEIVVFMGTWCSDSKREIPQFMNLLEQVDFDEEQLEIYALDGEKTSPEGTEKEYNIEYVPTIVFLKDGKEVNRFVEFAQESLAQDVLRIVKGEEYNNPYAE